MPNILYMTVSQDGFIAMEDDSTPWSYESWASFKEFVQSCDVVVVGRRTYQIMQRAEELVDGPRYIVASTLTRADLDAETIVIKSAADMPKGKRVGIIGGGELNGRLALMGLIDEMYLDIEPVSLNKGVRLFGKYTPELRLELLGSKPLNETTIQRHYKVHHN